MKFRPETKPLPDVEVRALIRVTRDESAIPEARIAARNAILVANSGWRYCIAARFVHSTHAQNVTAEDFADEGIFGEMRAIQKFDFRRKNKYITYASKWILQAIQHAAEKQEEAVYRPQYIQRTDRQIRRYLERLDCSEEEVGERLNIEPKILERIRRSRKQAWSLDALPDNSMLDPEAKEGRDAELRDQVDLLRRAIAGLDPRSREVVERRMRGELLKDVAAVFGLTKQWASKLEQDAHEQIRHKFIRANT